MAWSGSAIFREFVTDSLANAVAYDLSGAGVDAFKVALFGAGITPDKDATLTGYNEAAGQWVVAGEIIDTTGGTSWPTGGRPLVSPALTNPASGVVMWDATDTVSADATADIAAARGCLVYDDTQTSPADAGICYLDFGSNQSVTNGTFTVLYHANGLFRITV